MSDKYNRYYEIKSYKPRSGMRLEFGWDGRSLCDHIITGVDYWFECCKVWGSCRVCHRLSCNGNGIDNYLDEIGYLRGGKRRCISCLNEQKFGSGYCESCGRAFGELICVPCEIATDHVIYRHCYNCGYCVNIHYRENKHCNRCGDCLCSSDGGKLYNCYHPNNECSICMDHLNRLSRWEGRVIIRKCGHQFHNTCLTEWIKTNMSCPLCRKEFNRDDLIVRLEGIREVKQSPLYYARESVREVKRYFYEIGILESDIEIVNASAPPLLLYDFTAEVVKN